MVLLAQRREVDVIVAREPERLSRKSERRAFYSELCKTYGVEWRFANIKPDGKLPDTLEGRIVGMVAELFGELEAERIAERTIPVRERRYAAGFPHGGRYGPPYGYTWRPKGPNDKTYSAYEVNPEQAEIVREIYSCLANDEHATARSLAQELTRRGIPSPGNREWSGPHLIALVRNPIYCGRGRRKRWQLTMDEKVDEQTGQKNQYPSVHDRMKQPDYEDITYPLAEGAAPAIVDLAMWEAAQQAIKRNRMFGGKITRENSPHREQSTLLHGGFVYCTRCGGMMTRHWRSEYAEPKPSYRCTARASSPTHACAIHDINARVVDRIVLQRLAIALTDPEQLVELADAAEQQAAQAAAEVERAGTALAVYREMDAEREKARKGYMEAIAALSAIPGGANRETITDLRAKLARLDKDGAKLTRNANDLRRSKSAPFVVNEC